MAEKTAKGRGMVSRQRHAVVMAFRAILLSGLFAVLPNNLKEPAVVFIVGDPAGLGLTGNKGKDADDYDDQGDKEPVTFFDGHVNTLVQAMGG
jgi:hypothetical protein